MSRPEWLGPEPTGSLAVVIVLRAHLTVGLAYAELGLPVAPSTLAAIGDYLERLLLLLPLELGVPR